ncbi:MAG TPA: sodium-transporting two-sector ATPase [Candidatus Saccharimonadales bacterium]|nr:sodium-transporting two-sector ATPase [Candidatus Saccharimonadales bacterium]
MFDNSLFQQLVGKGGSTGEVVGSDRFLVSVKGLDGVAINALVLFESGERGIVSEVGEEIVLVLNLESETTPLGSLAVLYDNVFTTPVGEGLVGRVVTPLCQPLDGKGPITHTDNWPVYKQAPGMMERQLLSDRLPTGVTVVDQLFPVVLGQRIAVLGDTKSGKTTFLMQLGINQTNSDRIVVYVLIGKRRVEIDQLLNALNESGAINNSIVIVANIFDSLAQSYLAPYIGCAISEYLWQSVGRDVVIIYDDLSAHAKVYREVALLSGGNPGRDSYPGDMFFAHSSLLERAGRLASNGKTLTALPVIITPGDDITAFLPTSIMSITDGQIIFDLENFRRNIRPAVNAGLSVSRVGGRAQTPRQKKISGALFKRLADYRQAAEFAHFGSDLAAESKAAILLGEQIIDAMRQTPAELFTVTEQELVMETVLATAGQHQLNVGLLKMKAKEAALAITTDEQVDPAVQQLLAMSAMEAKK